MRSSFPRWLNPDLERRLGLRDRWRWYHVERQPEAIHPTRPRAQGALADLYYTNLFEAYDPGTELLSVEQRHPFFDVRLVELLMSSTPVPWCLDKHLLRTAMRGLLPEAVRRRRKTALPGSPRHPSSRALLDLLSRLAAGPHEISRFVSLNPVAGLAGPPSPRLGEVLLEDPTAKRRLLNLAYWLDSATLRWSTDGGV